MARIPCRKCGDIHDCPKTLSAQERGKLGALVRWHGQNNSQRLKSKVKATVSESLPSAFNPTLLEHK